MEDAKPFRYGELTEETLDAVFTAFKAILEGEHYTTVTVNEYFGWRPEVRTGQWLAPTTWLDTRDKSAIRIFRDMLTTDGMSWFSAGLTMHDSYGVWSLYCREKPYITVDYTKGQILVEHKAPAGNKLWWSFAVEYKDVE